MQLSCPLVVFVYICGHMKVRAYGLDSQDVVIRIPSTLYETVAQVRKLEK
jgi:hypothetical protein